MWSSEADLYEMLADRCRPGMRVLETGCGVSTLVFALCGADVTTVAFNASEAERFRAHCSARDIAIDAVQFHIGSSHDVLPFLPDEPLDIAFVDGGHGYPTPTVDALYAGRRLRVGGLLVLDDLNLPAVEFVGRVLDVDPTWQREGGTWKWGAWVRVGERQPFSTDHYQQDWLRPALDGSLIASLERNHPAIARPIAPVLRGLRRVVRPLRRRRR